jgi:hypothetical protein
LYPVFGRRRANSLRKFSAVAQRRKDLASIGIRSICSGLLNEELFGLAAVVAWRAEGC